MTTRFVKKKTQQRPKWPFRYHVENDPNHDLMIRFSDGNKITCAQQAGAVLALQDLDLLKHATVLSGTGIGSLVETVLMDCLNSLKGRTMRNRYEELAVQHQHQIYSTFDQMDWCNLTSPFKRDNNYNNRMEYSRNSKSSHKSVIDEMKETNDIEYDVQFQTNQNAIEYRLPSRNSISNGVDKFIMKQPEHGGSGMGRGRTGTGTDMIHKRTGNNGISRDKNHTNSSSSVVSESTNVLQKFAKKFRHSINPISKAIRKLNISDTESEMYFNYNQPNQNSYINYLIEPFLFKIRSFCTTNIERSMFVWRCLRPNYLIYNNYMASVNSYFQYSNIFYRHRFLKMFTAPSSFQSVTHNNRIPIMLVNAKYDAGKYSHKDMVEMSFIENSLQHHELPRGECLVCFTNDPCMPDSKFVTDIRYVPFQQEMNFPQIIPAVCCPSIFGNSAIQNMEISNGASIDPLASIACEDYYTKLQIGKHRKRCLIVLDGYTNGLDYYQQSSALQNSMRNELARICNSSHLNSLSMQRIYNASDDYPLAFMEKVISFNTCPVESRHLAQWIESNSTNPIRFEAMTEYMFETMVNWGYALTWSTYASSHTNSFLMPLYVTTQRQRLLNEHPTFRLPFPESDEFDLQRVLSNIKQGETSYTIEDNFNMEYWIEEERKERERKQQERSQHYNNGKEHIKSEDDTFDDDTDNVVTAQTSHTINEEKIKNENHHNSHHIVINVNDANNNSKEKYYKKVITNGQVEYILVEEVQENEQNTTSSGQEDEGNVVP